MPASPARSQAAKPVQYPAHFRHCFQQNALLCFFFFFYDFHHFVLNFIIFIFCFFILLGVFFLANFGSAIILFYGHRSSVPCFTIYQQHVFPPGTPPYRVR